MLTDRQIGVLRNLGPSSSFDEDKKQIVLEMLARGYIERDGGDLFKLTAIGLKETAGKPVGSLKIPVDSRLGRERPLSGVG